MATPKTDEAGIRQTIRALRAAGYVLVGVYDGEEDIDVSTESDAVEAITAVDDARLYVKHPQRKGSPNVRFVMGNDPEEVICDHSDSLSPVLDPLMRRWAA